MTNYEPLISVIIPVYKVERFLHRCIDSVIHQTYTNWEMILVDDGSPDTSGDICDEYAKKDERIKVIHQKNKGLSGARNAGLDKALGEWIYFLDSDDYIKDNTLEEMIRYSNDGYYDVVSATTVALLANGVFYQSEKAEAETDINKIRKGVLLDTVWNLACAKLIKATIFENLRFPLNRVREDLYMVPHIFFAAKTARVVPISFYVYSKENANSLSNGTDLVNTIKFKIGGFLGWMDHAELARNIDRNIEEICRARAIREGIKALVYHSGYPVLPEEEVNAVKEALILHKDVTLSFKQKVLRYFILHDFYCILFLVGKGRGMAFKVRTYFRKLRWKKYGLMS